MHEYMARQIAIFGAKTAGKWPNPRIAEIGSLIIAGTARDYLPSTVTGFDIVPGPGVDVLVDPGMTPAEHRGKYGAVVGANSFQFCGQSKKYREQVCQLLAPGGWFFISMCGPECKAEHSTSRNTFDWGDMFRWEPDKFKSFWVSTPGLADITVTEHLKGHNDLIAIGEMEGE